MCRQVSCKKCGQPTWAGCGQHVEQVLGHIPESERCQGHTDDPKNSGAASRSWLQRLLGAGRG